MLAKLTWQVSHSLLIDWSCEHTRPKTRKPFHKVVSDISQIHDCSWICRQQFIICLYLISCPYSLTIFVMPKGIILTMWNLHMISWLQASHNPLMSFQVFSHLIVSKSSSTGAPYLALQIQIGWRRVKTCRLCSAKHCLLRVVKAKQNLTGAVDWLDSLIGLGGLLLVVSDLFPVPVSPLEVTLQTRK